MIESPPILSPDPKRLCNMRLVTAVEKLLGKIVFPELEPEDGVDGPGHGRAAVAHLFLFFFLLSFDCLSQTLANHPTVDCEVISHRGSCHWFLKGKRHEYGVRLGTVF